MDNPYLKAQCQNMVSALAAFSTACELAAYEDDGSLSKEELRQLRRIHAAAARFQAELQREMEKRHVPTAKRLSAGCRSQKDGEYGTVLPMESELFGGKAVSLSERLAEDHIRTWSNEGDLVLAPFDKDGTVAKIAPLLERRWLSLQNAADCDGLRDNAG